MKTGITRCLWALIPVLLAGCAPQTPAGDQEETASLAAIPRLPDGKPDLNGIWQALNSANWNLEPHPASQGATEVLGAIGAVAPGVGVVEGGPIPYLPEALAQRDLNFASRRTEDPEAKCFRPGVPRATYLPYPFQIFQTESEVFLTYEFASATRTVNLQEAVEAPFDSWMGWSNGRWEGDTLVIDVTAQNGMSWLDRAGNFASAGVHVTERYTLSGPDHILYSATIEDPAVFSRPWTLSMPLYRLIEPSAQLLEFKCVEFAEELMYGHLSKSATATGGPDDE
jgi:hypothetical protein